MVEPPVDFEVPSDKDAILSTPEGNSQHILVTANRYADNPHQEHEGALIEETSAFRSDIELFWDLHTLVWDPATAETLDFRNDAVASELRWASPRVPELLMQNEFAFADGTTATLNQSVVTGSNQCSIILDNRMEFEVNRSRTLYTTSNLGIKGHSHENPRAVQAAHVRHEDDCDVITATDGNRHVAFAQAHDGRRRFDGHRVGRTDLREGPAKSAWTDIYEENDGWIDSNESESGNLDIGVGLHTADVESVEWQTAIGFATSEDNAVANARGALDAGYEAERVAFAESWEAWHDGVRSAPTGDDTVDDRYARSMTSMKCSQDHCRAMVAGAFKPQNMSYKFIWPRDQVVIIQALLAGGATDEARQSLAWLADVQITDEDPVTDDRGTDRRGTWWQNYFTTGEAHWTALQLDQVGGPIYAHWLCWTETGDAELLEEYYEMSERAAEFLLSWDNDWGFPRKHQDPWEEVWGYSTEGVASAIAGLRSMAAMADAVGDAELAERCRERADSWAGNMATYCFRQNTPYGDHYVTAAEPESDYLSPDERPDAAAFMAHWPWNVLDAEDNGLLSTAKLADDGAWGADDTPCLGRYPNDHYTPTGEPTDGGWPLCEAYADVVRWQTGLDEDAVRDHVYDHAGEWTTSAGLLPERVDSEGQVDWNSNLQWSQAMYVLLVESHERGEPYGLAPSE